MQRSKLFSLYVDISIGKGVSHMGFGNFTVRGDDCAEAGIIELDGSQRECNSSTKQKLPFENEAWLQNKAL